MCEKDDTQSTDNELNITGKPSDDGGSIEKELSRPDDVNSSKEKSSAEPHSESLYDWFVLLCTLLSNTINGIDYASHGILYLPLTEMFDASRAAVGWIQGFDFALGSLLGIFFSRAVNKFGCRRPAIVGSCLIATGVMLSCFSPSLGWMYLLRGIVTGVGQSMTMLSYSVIIQQRFSKHRSLAAGISILGFTIGNFVGSPLTEFLLNSYGVRGALALLGALQAHRIPLALQFHSPKQFKAASNQTQMSDEDHTTVREKLASYFKGSLDFSLLKQTTFLLFCIIGILQKFLVHSYVPHAVNWAIAAGLKRRLAVWAVPVFSFSTITCRIAVLSIADLKCVNRLVVYSCGMFFAFLTCIPPIAISGIVGTFMSAILFGFYAGCTHTFLSVILVDLQGVHRIARCHALFSFFTTFSQLTSTSFMGLMYDVTSSYTVGFLVLAALALTGFVLMVTICILDRHARRKRTQQLQL